MEDTSSTVTALLDGVIDHSLAPKRGMAPIPADPIRRHRSSGQKAADAAKTVLREAFRNLKDKG
jgi:hypothetical protein